MGLGLGRNDVCLLGRWIRGLGGCAVGLFQFFAKAFGGVYGCYRVDNGLIFHRNCLGVLVGSRAW